MINSREHAWNIIKNRQRADGTFYTCIPLHIQKFSITALNNLFYWKLNNTRQQVQRRGVSSRGRAPLPNKWGNFHTSRHRRKASLQSTDPLIRTCTWCSNTFPSAWTFKGHFRTFLTIGFELDSFPFCVRMRILMATDAECIQPSLRIEAE